MRTDLKKYGVFASGSAFGAVIDYVCTLAAVRGLGMNPELALGLAMILSATAVFFWHDHITFLSSGRAGLGRRYLMFMGWSLIVYLIRAALLVVLRGMGLPLAIALGVSILIASLINYLLSSRAIFRAHQG